MTTELPDRDPTLAQMTTEELLKLGLTATEKAKELDFEARAQRGLRCAVLDELNRHRDLHADKDDPMRGYRIAACADEWGMRYQSLRSSIQAWWDNRKITYSPDDRPVLTDENRRDIRERFQGGESKRSIASDYGVARATVAALVEDIDEERAKVKNAKVQAKAVENLTLRVQGT